jgi:large subunit ribosomal protein L25
MAELTLQTEKRDLQGRATNALREEGKVPGIMYGDGTDPISMTMDRNTIQKLYNQVGESSVITVTHDGQEHPVLIQEIQYDPLTDFITHVDLRRVDLTKKVDAAIRLTLVGEAPAVKELGGTLLQTLDEVEVSALPAALVAVIEVDVSTLKTFDDAIHVSDLIVPEGIEIMTTETRTIAGVQAPRTSEEMEALDEAPVDGVAEAAEAEGEESEVKEGEDAEEKA